MEVFHHLVTTIKISHCDHLLIIIKKQAVDLQVVGFMVLGIEVGNLDFHGINAGLVVVNNEHVKMHRVAIISVNG